MEFNAEINKVFGTEMAKLFAATISEEDMLKLAKEVWNQMTHREYRYCEHQPSEVDKFVKQILRERMVEEVGKLMETEAFKQSVVKAAEEIVAEIQEETHKKIVEEVSSRLCGMSVGGYGCGLKGMIEETVMEMMR